MLVVTDGQPYGLDEEVSLTGKNAPEVRTLRDVYRLMFLRPDQEAIANWSDLQQWIKKEGWALRRK